MLMHARYPLSLRNVEDLLFEQGIDICHATVRLCWNRGGHGPPEAITTDGLRSYGAAMSELGNRAKQEVGRWANNRVDRKTCKERRSAAFAQWQSIAS